MREGNVQAVAGDTYWNTKRTYSDLIFLLSPRDWEVQSLSIIKTVGQVLQFQRLRLGLSLIDLAATLNLSESDLIGIEQATILRKRGRFSSYLAYSSFLGQSLRSLFTTSLMTEKEDCNYESYIKVERQRKIISAIAELGNVGGFATYARIASLTGISRTDLIFDKELNQLMLPFLDELNSDSL